MMSPSVRNFLFLFLSQGFGKVTGLIFGFVAARVLGAAGFGDYAMLNAFLSYALVVTDFGLSSLLVRDMSQRPDQAQRIFASGLTLRGALATGAFFTILIAAIFLRLSGLFFACLVLAGLGAILYAWNSTLTDFLTAQERLRHAAMLDMLCQIVFLLFVIALLRVTSSILAIFVALFIANGLRALILGYLARASLRHIRWGQIDVPACKQMASQSLYFGLLALLGTLYLKVDVILLYVFKPGAAVGWYEGAFRILEAAMILSASLMTALFPAISRLSHRTEDVGELRRMLIRAEKFLIVTGALGMLLISLAARPLIRFCYGQDFLPAVGLVPVLMLALFCMHVNAPFGRLLLARDQQRRVVFFTAICLGANVFGNLLLIPRYGAYGAAWATVFSELVAFAIFYPAVAMQLGMDPWWLFRRAIRSTA